MGGSLYFSMTGVDVLVQVGGGGGEHELAGRRSDKSAVARS